MTSFYSNLTRDQVAALRRMTKPSKPSISRDEAVDIGGALGLDWKKYKLEQFRRGLEVELEHKTVTHGDMYMTGLIVKDHLDENPNYYTILDRVGL